MKASHRKHLAILSTALVAAELLILSLPSGWPLAPQVVLAASVTVNSTTDVADGDTSSIANLIANPGPDGVISLREALLASNNTAGPNTITFSIGTGLQTINVTSALPTILQPVTIDGTSQPGFSGTPLIVLAGGGTPGDGLVLQAGNSTVRDLVINGFAGNGISVQSSNNTVSGNFIGTDSNGTAAVPNALNGIIVNNASGNIIGGTNPGDSNIIAFNTLVGVVIAGTSTGDQILTNSIFSNGGLGIDLGNDGVTPNDPGDADTGPNNLQNFPVIIAAVETNPTTTIDFSLNSTANTTFRLEFFSNPVADPSGNGEGQVFLGSTTITTDGTGNFSDEFVAGTDTPAAQFVTATATDPAGNTSEFSAAQVVISPRGAGSMVVNSNLDTADANVGDGICATSTGVCTLRAAIQTANVAAGTNTITFNIAPGGLQTITLGSALPKLTQPVVIDATTQPGFAGTPLIEINGANRGIEGLDIAGGNSTVRGLIINRCGNNGIKIETATGNVIAGNFIGTNATGTAALPNNKDGINISGPGGNTIGGLTPADRNVISGNGVHGVDLQTTTTGTDTIIGNFIGTNATGTAAVGNGTNGVNINTLSEIIGGGASGARNIISGNGNAGVFVQKGGTPANKIQGNFIGTDVNGTAAIPNLVGVILPGNVTFAIVGTDGDGTNDTTEGNVISGNTQDGVQLTSGGNHDNRVSGNFIGVDVSGSVVLANGANGVFCTGDPVSNIFGTDSNGTSDVAERNVISGNVADGIHLDKCSSNKIAGNFIGTNAAGTAVIPNQANGVFLINTAKNNIIGSNSDGVNDNVEANLIEGNTGNGIAIVTDGSDGNRINQNSIFNNGLLAIDLGNDGVTANDLKDPDHGPNQTQNFPTITSARQGSTIINFTFNSLANQTFRIEFFSNTAADPSGHGEGQTFIGSTSVTTDANGNFTGTVTFATTLPVGAVVTATATDSLGNTSEFSNTRVVQTPTAVKFAEADATRYERTNVVEWRTGYESDNLGFDVYREVNGTRRLVTPQPVAGSALFTAAHTELTAGKPYVWIDRDAPSQAIYWLEDIDLSGARQLHGPIVPQPAISRPSTRRSSLLLNELRSSPTAGNGSNIREGPPSMFVDQIDNNSIADQSRSAASKAEGQTESLTPLSPQVSGLLSTQPLLKIAVDHDGWYRVALPAESKLRFVTLARLQLTSGGQLVPYRVADNSIEFYGQALDTPTTGERIYWLANGLVAGPQIPSVAVGSTNAFGPVSFNYTVERRDRTLYFSSLLNGDTENIFGPLINGTAIIQSLDLRAVDAAQPGTLEVRLQGVTAATHVVHVLLGGVELGIAQLKGQENRTTSFPLSANALHEGQNDLSLQSSNGPTDLSLLDRVRLTYARRYTADNNQLQFTMAPGSPATVTGFTESTVNVFDITDPNHPAELQVKATASGTGAFSLTVPAAPAARTLLAVGRSSISSVPGSLTTLTNWSASTHKDDLVIITHGDFRQAADRLAAYRRGQGLLVEVADVEDLFNEFSDGEHTPVALRNFLQTTPHWKRPPRYVLLIGDATWDPHNYFGRGEADFVPTKLIDTANMETSSDDWLVDFNRDGLPELSLGRLPVRTLDEANLVVDKLINFDAPIAGPRAAVFVADTGFASDSAADQALIPAGQPLTVINRAPGADAETRTQILAALNQGPRLVNFVGHGSVGVWTGAGLLRTSDGALLTNSNRLSVMILLTCLNGYMHDVFTDSLGEGMLLAPHGGAAAVWASSGMTEPQAQQQMAQRLYQQLRGGSAHLGDALVAAKAATTDADVRRTWMLLGDPTMQFAWPAVAPVRRTDRQSTRGELAR